LRKFLGRVILVIIRIIFCLHVETNPRIGSTFGAKKIDDGFRNCWTVLEANVNQGGTVCSESQDGIVSDEMTHGEVDIVELVALPCKIDGSLIRNCAAEGEVSISQSRTVVS